MPHVAVLQATVAVTVHQDFHHTEVCEVSELGWMCSLFILLSGARLEDALHIRADVVA